MNTPKLATHVAAMLTLIGEDICRPGLKETPERVARAYKEMFSGYDENHADIIKLFQEDARDEMVLVSDIPVYSHCEHHIAPIFGVAHIGYVPKGKVLGLSKFKRLVDVYAKRLQVQERLTQELCTAMTLIQPSWVGVVVEARHMCMEMRGVNTQGSVTRTSAYYFDTTLDDEVRREHYSEFHRLLQMNGGR